MLSDWFHNAGAENHWSHCNVIHQIHYTNVTSSDPSFGIEESRIREAYARRRPNPRYSWFNPGHLFMAQEEERRILGLLSKRGYTALDKLHILEIGCGTGHWLREFIKWGMSPANIVGVDLLSGHIARAKELCPESVQFECGNAAKLNFPDSTFDIVFQATVFTSIMDAELKKQVASEMVRVVKNGGLIVWYDYFLNNPSNRDVRGVRKSEIKQLFEGCEIDLQRMTLAPPIVRRVAPHSWLLCHLLQKVPWLCAFYLGAIQKNAGVYRP